MILCNKKTDLKSNAKDCVNKVVMWKAIIGLVPNGEGVQANCLLK